MHTSYASSVHTSDRQFIFKMCSHERESLLYEVFLDRGIDVFMKKENMKRGHRPIVEYDLSL